MHRSVTDVYGSGEPGKLVIRAGGDLTALPQHNVSGAAAVCKQLAAERLRDAK